MKVYEGGIIRIDCQLHVVAVTPKGSMQMAHCKIIPGILTVSTISMNQKQFCINGHWFYMDDFQFEKPILVDQEI